MEELIKQFIKPELMVIVLVLYFIGMGIKSSKIIKAKFIPILLGILGVLIAGIYVMATSCIRNYQEILIAIFTSITQGVLLAGLSVYINQIQKQNRKEG